MSALHCSKRELVIMLQGEYSFFFFFGHTIKFAGSQFPSQVLNPRVPAVKICKAPSPNHGTARGFSEYS